VAVPTSSVPWPLSRCALESAIAMRSMRGGRAAASSSSVALERCTPVLTAAACGPLIALCHVDWAPCQTQGFGLHTWGDAEHTDWQSPLQPTGCGSATANPRLRPRQLFDGAPLRVAVWALSLDASAWHCMPLRSPPTPTLTPILAPVRAPAAGCRLKGRHIGTVRAGCIACSFRPVPNLRRALCRRRGDQY
jgi:hypothetical protein